MTHIKNYLFLLLLSTVLFAQSDFDVVSVTVDKSNIEVVKGKEFTVTLFAEIKQWLAYKFQHP